MEQTDKRLLIENENNSKQMTRRITILIKNNTNITWQLINEENDTKLKHGKWMKNSPPQTIAPHTEVELKSEKQTGTLYGTTGRITYQNKLDHFCAMVITWNKPFGSDPTSCETYVTSDKFESVVKNKDFQKSEAFCDVVLKEAEQLYKIKNWMGENWNLIKNKTLSKICLPGSHDSGIFKLTYNTKFSSPRNTVTQRYPIEQQIKQGVRYFDIRPAYSEGEFWTAHYSKVKSLIGYQGGFGENLRDILNSIRNFFELEENKRELLILNFSHMINWDDRDSYPNLTDTHKKYLLKIISELIGDFLIKNKTIKLTNHTISELLELGNVIPVFPDNFGITNNDAENGFWKEMYLPIKGGYSNTNDLKYMISSQLEKLENSAKYIEQNILFRLCWQLTLSDRESTISSLSILDYADIANAELFNMISTWIANDTINSKVYPNIINTDSCCEGATRAVRLSLDITKKINEE